MPLRVRVKVRVRVGVRVGVRVRVRAMNSTEGIAFESFFMKCSPPSSQSPDRVQ